jgi:hypothetical protein
MLGDNVLERVSYENGNLKLEWNGGEVSSIDMSDSVGWVGASDCASLGVSQGNITTHTSECGCITADVATIGTIAVDSSAINGYVNTGYITADTYSSNRIKSIEEMIEEAMKKPNHIDGSDTFVRRSNKHKRKYHIPIK